MAKKPLRHLKEAVMSIEIDPAFYFPGDASGELFYNGRLREGTLKDLLAIYRSLDQSSRDKACIRLHRRVILPGGRGGPPRESPLTLYDGEIALLLPYAE